MVKLLKCILIVILIPKVYYIQTSLTRIDTTDAGREQINAGNKISDEYILRQDLSAQDVTQYKIKGYWYFDKRQVN
jgi:hypothetical protein